VATLVDEWVRAGLTEAVVLPRLAFHALALAWPPGPSWNSMSAGRAGCGFFAWVRLGHGAPGCGVRDQRTAAAELHASVLEADASRVPMLVCTADRPPELHDVGAAQTIDQHGLFAPPRGSRRAGRSPTHHAGDLALARARLIAETTEARSGRTVHVNLAFREPLLGEVEQLPPGTTRRAPWHRVAVRPPCRFSWA